MILVVPQRAEHPAGPQNATELLVTYSYAQGFDARAQGYGTAIGLVVLAVVGIGTALWWRVQARTEDTAVVER